MRVTRYHEISCGHVLSGHEGKCGRLHGHNYRIGFSIDGPVDKEGMVLDFGVMKSTLCRWLDESWDHRFLIWDRDPMYDGLKKVDSTVVGVPFNPTAEGMADYLLKVVGLKVAPWGCVVSEVSVEETGKCSVVANK